VANTLLELGSRVDAIGVVAADHPLVSQAIEQLSSRGVRVYGFMSELTASHRAGYVGIDNRRAGRTAGWAIAHLSKRPGKVATLMGDHRLLCQEYSEIGLRSYLRECSGAFEVLEPILSLESPDRAWQATHELLAQHADMAGIYVNSGCVEGVIRALRETGRHREIVTVCHEVTDVTRAALIDNVIQVVVAHPLAETARTLVNALTGMHSDEQHGASPQWTVPVSVLTSENI
jgi:LacI family transcriptional regulator